MPLSPRLRSRPKRTASRPLSARGAGVGLLAQLLPKTIVLPILILAGVTATAAALWTYDMHIEQAYGDIEDGASPGTVDSAE